VSSNNVIPPAVVVAVSDALAWGYTHTQLNGLFARCGAPGEPPEGNKEDKCRAWLGRVNKEGKLNAHQVLGELIGEFMDRDNAGDEYEKRRDDIRKQLARYGLTYQLGGQILGGGGMPTRTLEVLLKEHNFSTVDQEFQRALDTVIADPPAAVTSACAIMEALCKIYIGDERLDMPDKQDLRNVWKVVQKHMGLEPTSVEDDDLKRILQGLASVADGISAFRTHAGSAHGRGRTAYRPAPRHARLAIHAAHTVVTFLIETWESRKSSAR
jgi:hypothetical protein